jgi:LysR family glycine cleavage system transcriptional activator
MAKHLPSLSALRAFEATARHLSFTRAASELHLTQTAISHRLKELEGMLSVQLFTRRQNSIALTDEGRSYLELIRPALAQIAIATDSVSSMRENRLNISCLSAFAIKCLMPALGDFRQHHPDVDIRITPVAVSAPANQHDFDVAIWHGLNDWPGFDAERIGCDEIFPVCSPRLLASGPPLRTPEDLRHYTILRTVSPIIVDEWPAWLQHASADRIEFGNEINCDALFLSLEAALSGVGLCIGRTPLVKDDLASGRLIEPFSLRLPIESAYYVASRKDKSSMAKVVQFRTWLLKYFGSDASTNMHAGAPLTA